MAENQKKISIILPVYNGERYLRESLDSILGQTYQNFELIIVDDCSSDSTGQIISEYMERDKRISSVKNAINMKLPKSLNVGFGNATGDYLTWTSDDNKYKPNALETMVKYLEDYPSVSMVYTNYTEIDTNGNITKEKELDDIRRIAFKNVVGASFLYRREAAEQVGEYDSNLFLAEDYDYWIRICKNGEIVHLNKSLYYYRKHEKSLTSQRYENAVKQTYKVLEKHFLFLYSLAQNQAEGLKFLLEMDEWGRYSNHKQVREQLGKVCFRFRIVIAKKKICEKVYNELRKVKHRLFR